MASSIMYVLWCSRATPFWCFREAVAKYLKRQGEQYQLIWKQRYGFLKLAQEFNYDIVPFAALAGDEVYEIGFDANKIIQHKYFQKLLKVP